jgi:hypothetical protein
MDAASESTTTTRASGLSFSTACRASMAVLYVPESWEESAKCSTSSPRSACARNGSTYVGSVIWAVVGLAPSRMRR